MKKINILLFLLINFSPISAQTQTTLISWNIQDFGKSKSAETINKIATIVKDYDIVALQEVVSGYGGAQAVARLADELNRKGAKWDYVISNPTKSPPYKTERYAFLWKPHKVKAIGRGNLVGKLQNVVYREPFELVFLKNAKKIKILNYHSRKHDDLPEKETKPLIHYMLKQHIPTILAGDFNISETNKVFNELYSKDYISAIKNQRTTLKRKCKTGKYLYHNIDNIYLPSKYLTLNEAGILDFIKDCENLIEARTISDHVPVFVVFTF